MTAYHSQLTPPVGAFQQDVDAIDHSLNPITRAGGVTDSNGRGHGNLAPGQALQIGIGSRGSDIEFLQGKTFGVLPPNHNPGLSL